ncbi:phosphatase PAP2 family protein [Hymenobacter sp. BT18]|uniref:phosphatase PAP2 family protein n=1 Tax=Hymenobacter sp. BT18 TaxID=2835648 RepID=UPI00143EBF15|nr:phosphatase PAP2 family protein [Hymenobacter sp. BT18]QIX62624.1 phosphatase PAP2 family protein [Hymenobacter sp. BT18]
MRNVVARLLARLAVFTTEAAVLGLVFGAALLLFFYLTRVVFVEKSAALDSWAFQQMDTLRAAWPGLTPLARGITLFASLPFLVAAGLLIPGGLARVGYRREAWEVLLAVAGSALFNQLLKVHYQRGRPLSALLPQPGLSFPSGHAMIGMALYGCLAWLLWRHARRPGWALVLLGWALLIGLTRIYLHVHYATDVLAGFAAGLMWLALLRLVLEFNFHAQGK